MQLFNHFNNLFLKVYSSSVVKTFLKNYYILEKNLFSFIYFYDISNAIN
jgi:hypothetical protein